MISYELAKKLKEAGWSQVILEGDYYYDERCEKTNRIAHLSSGGGFSDGEKYTMAIPTLEELIGACGEGFSQLHRFDDGEFGAFSESNWGNAPDGIEANGKTPEEAVSNLWLSLKEKVSTLD